MSLRQEVIETGARGMADHFVSEGGCGVEWTPWDELYDTEREYWRRRFTAALDAALDCLTENADEWWDAWFDSSRDLYDSLNDDHIRQLLAILREETT